MIYKIILGSLGLVAIGAAIYYKDELYELYQYKKEESRISEQAKKKIKSKAINIKIENLNEL